MRSLLVILFSWFLLLTCCKAYATDSTLYDTNKSLSDTNISSDSLVNPKISVFSESLNKDNRISLGVHNLVDKNYSFHPNQVISPTILLSLGIIGTTEHLFDFKDSAHQSFHWAQHVQIDNYLQYLPVTAYLALGFIPTLNKRGDFKDHLMAGVTAYASMAVITNLMKYSFREKRPGSNQRNSFPSGHSATVFTGAELMRIEYGNEVGLAGYATAFAVGFLRMYNDKHWINDVLGGAAIGILCARIGYWLLPFERKLFGIKKKDKSKGEILLTPTVGQSNGFSCFIKF